METKGFFKLKIIINVLGSSFRFISIPMLWVYAHFKYSHCGHGRQDVTILKSKVDPHAVRIKELNMAAQQTQDVELMLV